ncbi:threonine/serine ThrE exporter family protein [Longispora albida]|uniref:threonine/serine ThrE exporter family protein n=1 Tax=Longispora albida TaxID=203523 RepID=UPI000368AFDE|nr:threonine/serine exporter family protein [Longispora albida]
MTEPGDLAELLTFLRRLGVAMCDAGDPVNQTTERLQRIADAYGADQVRLFVLPTGVFVRVGGPSGSADFSEATGSGLRLDQITRLYELIADATVARVTPAEGLARLDEIREAPPRFGTWTTLLGHVFFTVGVGLLVEPTLRAVGAFVVLGFGVGLLGLLARRSRSLSLALPVLASMLVTAIAYQVAGPWLNDTALRILIPPLVSFLPGATLTMATVELATGAMISGSARLVYGVSRLLLLAFGIAAGTQLAGAHEADVTKIAPLGAWAPWLGVAIFGLGVYFYFSAPTRSLLWLTLMLYVAYAGQYFGTLLIGARFSGFVGALVMTVAAYWLQRLPSAPPAQVLFLPAFWLLVPGALGLLSLTELATDVPIGARDAIGALLTLVSIALGMLVGSSLGRYSFKDLMEVVPYRAARRR